MSVVSGELKSKRAELSERVSALAAELAEVQAQVAAIDKVIAIYEPDWQPEAKPRKRRGRAIKSEALKELDGIIGETNKRQMTLDILRTAEGPMSTAECAERFAERHGLTADDPRLGTIANRLSSTLDSLYKANRVRHAPDAEDGRRRWEIAA